MARTIQTVDYVVVGGGIAGLYTCMLLKERDPKASVVLLEASHHIGGRARTHPFNGMNVPMGAGIGRSRDVLLKGLVNKLGQGPVVTTPKRVYLQAELAPLRSRWQRMWKKIIRESVNYNGLPFGKAINAILGENKAQLFRTLSGYTDFDDAETLDVVQNYGIMDNLPSDGLIFYVQWKNLIEELLKHIIDVGVIVRKKAVVKHISGGQVEFTYGASPYSFGAYQARKHIFVGVPLPQLLKLFPDHIPLRSLGGQPFIRVYAQLEQPLAIEGYTVVNNELQKVIPMSKDKRTIMIAYADNAHANECWKHAVAGNKLWFAHRLTEAFHAAPNVRIVKMWYKYWRVGTHYFKDRDVKRLSDLQSVSHRITLVGEAVSHKQGWVEGALESVHAAIRNLCD